MKKNFDDLNSSLNDFSDNKAWNNVVKQLTNMINLIADLPKEFDKAEEAVGAYAKVAAAGFSAVGSMMQMFADQQDANTMEGFEKQKKFQIAATTMNMLGGIASAMASAFSPVNAELSLWGQIAMAAAMSTMMLGTGIAQIEQIKRQQFNGGSVGASSSSASAPAVTVNEDALAALNNSVQYTQDVQGAGIESAIASQRVYVVETDITKTQKAVAVQESENRY